MHVFSYTHLHIKPSFTPIPSPKKIRPLEILRHCHTTKQAPPNPTMVTMSNTPSQTATPTVTINPNNQEMNSDYEKCREERIKQNLERMQKLGIYDLSLKLKSIKPNRYKKNINQNKTPNGCISPLPPSGPTRRSSRLQNTPVVSYAEVVVPKKGKDARDILMMENSRPEVYTEEHEKMLGDTKTEWTLFVDGYGKDGKRIYDQVRGKTCHQCRQKTLGHRTHCIRCNLVQGQFCGDCLYMRYGENVLEAMQNPDWICPGCRGICNCSLCRQAKGWAPTGMLYRKITSLGYKSVAHYLIQTRRSDPDSEKNEEKTETPVSAKRSLPFSREAVESKEGVAKTEESKHKNSEAGVEFEDGIASKELRADERPNGLESSDEDGVATNEKLEKFESEDGIATKKVSEDETPTELESSDEPLCNNVTQENTEESKDNNPESKVDENKNKVNESEGDLEIINPECKDNSGDDNEVKTSIVTPETKKGSRKKRQIVLLENSIAGRLRSRRKCT